MRIIPVVAVALVAISVIGRQRRLSEITVGKISTETFGASCTRRCMPRVRRAVAPGSASLAQMIICRAGYRAVVVALANVFFATRGR